MLIRIWRLVIRGFIVGIVSLIVSGQTVAAPESASYGIVDRGSFGAEHDLQITGRETGVKANPNITNPAFPAMVAERDKQSLDLQIQSPPRGDDRGATAQTPPPSEATPADPSRHDGSSTGKLIPGETYSGDDRCDMDEVRNREF